MARECGPSPPMRNRMDALHSTVCSAIIRISRRNRLIANSQMSRAQTSYTWHMGTHHSLDRLFAVARQERRCAIPSTNTDIQAIRRRVKTGAVLRVFRGLYAEPAYWESLDPHEQVRHIVRALAIQHPDWVFCGPTAAIMHGLDCSYRLAFPICIVASPGAHHQDTRHISHHAITHPDITVVQGVKVISLLQTLFGLAACQPLRYALGPADCALRNGLVSESVLRAYPSSVKYSRNRAAVERAFALADRRAENGGESEARGMLHDAGCPPDDIQVEFPCLDHPGRKHRSDFLWKREDGSVIVGEFDGVRKYVDPHMTSGREIREVVDEERKRQQCMSQYAIGMVRMYYRDLDNPGRIVRQLRDMGIQP